MLDFPVDKVVMRRIAVLVQLKYNPILSRVGPFLFLCAVWFLTPWGEAHACTCANATVSVWPNGRRAAPINTQIWVRLPAYNTKLPYEKYSDFKKYPRFWSARFTQSQMAILLVDRKKKSLPVYKTDLNLGQWRMSVLRPQNPLLPKQKYDVYIQAQGGLSSLIGTFTTSSQVETTSQTKAGIQNARFLWERSTSGLCRPPGPYAVLDLKGAPSAPSSFFGVWMAGAEGKIDYKRAPHLVLQPKKGRLFLGQTSPCDDNNFIFPEGQSKITLGVRVGNLSGKWGTPQQVSFAKTATLEPWSWSPNARVFFWIAFGALLFFLSFFRTWLFQRASHRILSEFLETHEAIKNDMAWLALKQLVQRENSLRLKNFLVFFLQLLLFGLCVYVFVGEYSHFSISPISLAELYLVVAVWGTVLFLNAVIHLYFTFSIRAKRHSVSALPKSKMFEASSAELLARWRKK